MKQLRIFMPLFLLSGIILSSCSVSYQVVSKKDFDDAVLGVKNELEKQGYFQSGSSTDSKNLLQVEATSFSKSAGYGSKLTNDYVIIDSYRFMKDDGNTLNYSVSYKPNVRNGVAFVSDVSIVGCETSLAKNYETLCGENSSVKKLESIPRNTQLKVTDALGTSLVIGFLGAFVVGFIVYKRVGLQ